MQIINIMQTICAQTKQTIRLAPYKLTLQASPPLQNGHSIKAKIIAKL